MDQLFAGTVVIPFAVALDDLDQVIGRFLAPAGCIKCDREVEARLMVERTGGHLLFKLADRAGRFRLLGDFERGTRRRDGGIVVLGFRNARERLLGLLQRAGRHIGACETRERRHVAWIFVKHFGVERDRVFGVTRRQRLFGGFQ